VVEFLIALPVVLWGGALTTWFAARGIAVKFWATVVAFAGTAIPGLIIVAMDQSVREVVSKAFN
jgi:hypothetical protein